MIQHVGRYLTRTEAKNREILVAGFGIVPVFFLAGWMAAFSLIAAEPEGPVRWKHLSSATGDLPAPMPGDQQTASLVLDVDRDGIEDFIITERTKRPSVVWFRRVASGWKRYVIDDTQLWIEAGGSFHDIDGDGDLDVSFAGDSRSNAVWWWENPHPNFSPEEAWKRHPIKKSGANKHHDQLFGDFDSDGRTELVFWNQKARSLFLAEIPPDPRQSVEWPLTVIYSWEEGADAEHEGLAQADVDGDGKLDIVGGGNWYRHERGGQFSAHAIDKRRRFTRAAVGQLVDGGRPEVVFSPGDADGPLSWYQWDAGRWIRHTLLDKVIHGHTLDVADLDGDGHMDVFSAEMNLRDANPNAKIRIFYGDGKGRFRQTVVASGVANHESRLGDLDGDGDLDILGKPYNWQTPRIDIWLNEGRKAGRH